MLGEGTEELRKKTETRSQKFNIRITRKVLPSKRKKNKKSVIGGECSVFVSVSNPLSIAHIIWLQSNLSKILWNRYFSQTTENILDMYKLFCFCLNCFRIKPILINAFWSKPCNCWRDLPNFMNMTINFNTQFSRPREAKGGF